MQFRIGTGFDVHALVENRDLILAGVRVPYDRGLLGHSDADVALHALMDALLGAAGKGDIGKHFPDTHYRAAAKISSVYCNYAGSCCRRFGHYGRRSEYKSDDYGKTRLHRKRRRHCCRGGGQYCKRLSHMWL